MISKFIKEGDRVEITALGRAADIKNLYDENAKKSYGTKVATIINEETIELLMPMEGTKLVLLPVDGEYNVIFYTATGLFQAFVRVIDRYKSNNLYIVAIELTSNLRKYQRREYYRFSCALEMCARNLEEEELEQFEKKNPVWFQPNLPIKRSVIVDISGGGLRFMSNQKYDEGSMIYCSYNLVKDGVVNRFELVGKVLAVRELDNRPGTFEHRVQYHNMDEAVREQIIRFIFEEERRSRRRD